MFESLQAAPPDPILGLTDAFRNDPSPLKINLGVGVFKDASGATPVLDSVKQAERRLVEQQGTKGYLSIEGDRAFCQQIGHLLFGETVPSNRLAILQAPGGTGALRTAGEFIQQMIPGARLWRSNPTWVNHDGVFAAAGLEVLTYAYFDPQRNDLDFDAMQRDLAQLRKGDVVLLHGCCHNPTGVDLTLEQWRQLSKLLAERGALPLVDFAYQGFAQGVEADTTGFRQLLNDHQEILICSSCSKNFGLYCERVGALAAVSRTPDSATSILSHFKRIVRSNYSNPPSHGAVVVATILQDPDLKGLWMREVDAMRSRIHDMRTLFVDQLRRAGAKQDFSFIARQQGMFSFSGLNPDQVRRLREEYAIYIVGSGRMNVAGITEQNVERLCAAVVAVCS